MKDHADEQIPLITIIGVWWKEYIVYWREAFEAAHAAVGRVISRGIFFISGKK